MYDGEAPGAGLITGVARIEGRECVIVCNDSTIKGGTYYPMTVKKHLRAQEIAAKTGCPASISSTPAARTCRTRRKSFPTASISAASSTIRRGLSAAGIPQIAVVMGSCTAGGAYVPAMSDETIIVRGQGTIFLGGPPLVKAATGEVVSAEDLGGADVHARKSGVADHYAVDDQHALDIVRRIVANLNKPKRVDLETDEPREPKYDIAELDGIVPTDVRKQYDARELIARLVDASEFDEFKRLYGTTIVTGFARHTACRSASSPITAFFIPRARRRPRISSSSAASGAFRCCSCRTSRASWSARTTRRAASPRTAPRWSWRWPARRCRN
jgi:3-methylcrotonyl-CoA carboxylase beta subunit